MDAVLRRLWSGIKAFLRRGRDAQRDREVIQSRLRLYAAR